MTKNEQNVKIEVSPNHFGVVTILHGKALDPQPMQGLDISGNIETPQEFWELRGEDFNKQKCFVKRSSRSIELILNEDEPYIMGTIKGTLRLNEECSKWAINEPVVHDHKELARIIKRNEFLFDDREVWLKIYNSLVGFEASINIAIIDVKEASGDREMATKITVKNKVARSFKLKTKIFGKEKVTYEVDLNGEVNGHKVDFYLDSAQLAYLIDEAREKALEENTKIFKDQGVLVIDE